MKVKLIFKAETELVKVADLHGELPARGSAINTEEGVFYVEKGLSWTLEDDQLLPTLILNSTPPKRRKPLGRRNSTQL